MSKKCLAYPESLKVGDLLRDLLAVLAWVWKQNVVLSLVAGVALAANTLISVALGGILPLVLKRLRFDPALLAGPILTTVTDTCGFFMVLSLAAVFLSRPPGG